MWTAAWLDRCAFNRQERGGESGGGLVVAAVHDGVAAVGKRAIGDGALYAGDPGNPAGGVQARPKGQANEAQAGAVETPGESMNRAKCHNSRTDPFAFALRPKATAYS